MKRTNQLLFGMCILGIFIFASCKKEESEPTTNTTATTTTTPPTNTTTPTGGGCTSSLSDNTVKYGDTAVTMTNIVCNQNSFGKPRFSFNAKNIDNSISANVELRGTVPNSGDKFSFDPDLGDGTSSITLYYAAKNWTCKLDTTNMVTFTSQGDTHTVCASGVNFTNDADTSETKLVDFILSGDFTF